MKTVLTKEMKRTIDAILKLNRDDLSVTAEAGCLMAIVSIGKVKISFGDNSLIPDNIDTGLSNEMLRYIASFAPGSTIELLSENSNISIKSGRSKSRFATQKKTDIEFSECSSADFIEVDRSLFLEVLSKADSMCDPNITANRAVAGTIHIRYDSDSKKLFLLGTDGMELLRVCISPKNSPAKDLEFMLPTQAVKVILSIFKESDTIKIVSDGVMLTVQDEIGTRFDFRQVECSYPDQALANALKPEDNAVSFNFDPIQLIQVIDRCISLSGKDINPDFTVKISAAEKEMQIQNETSTSSFFDAVPVSFNEGSCIEDKELRFSPKRLRTMLKSFYDDEVTGYFGSYNRGGVFVEKNDYTEINGCVLPLMKKQ